MVEGEGAYLISSASEQVLFMHHIAIIIIFVASERFMHNHCITKIFKAKYCREEFQIARKDLFCIAYIIVIFVFVPCDKRYYR